MYSINLSNDIGETTNLAARNENLVKTLSNELFDYLHKVNAKFPVRDPLCDAEQEATRLKRKETEFMPRLEAQRILNLSKDFDPGNNWWGSQQ